MRGENSIRIKSSMIITREKNMLESCSNIVITFTLVKAKQATEQRIEYFII